MKNSKSAFTMIELIFVIIIIGVLGTMAISKLGTMKNTADIANARADVAAIRSAIFTDRQRSLVQGTASYITKLSPGSTSATYFTGDGGVGGNPIRTLLSYGLTKGTGAGEWEWVSDTSYKFHSGTQSTDFTYNTTTGVFNCVAGTQDCDRLAN